MIFNQIQQNKFFFIIYHECVVTNFYSNVQVSSPAKLALRRHLSQERIPGVQQHPSSLPNEPPTQAELQPQQHPSTIRQANNPPNNNNNRGNNGLLGTRTIGDLVSGEIERTLEISNQTIINAAVDMSVIMRPDNAFSPSSRPSNAEAENTGLATLAHVASFAPNPSPTSSAPPTTRSSVLFTPTNQPQRYTPVQLPRADIKPYHESYFADNPQQNRAPATAVNSPTAAPPSTNGEVPLEGLAASLHARIVKTQNGNTPKPEQPASVHGKR